MICIDFHRLKLRTDWKLHQLGLPVIEMMRGRGQLCLSGIIILYLEVG